MRLLKFQKYDKVWVVSINTSGQKLRPFCESARSWFQKPELLITAPERWRYFAIFQWLDVSTSNLPCWAMLPETPAQDRRKRPPCSSAKRKPTSSHTATVTKPSARTPTVRKPHKKKSAHKPPETPRDTREDEERLRRENCALCPNFKGLSRKDLRHKRFRSFSLENNESLLKNMKSIFPDYTCDKKGVPIALCYNHCTSVKMHGNKSREHFSAEFITSRNATFKSAPLYRKASHSTPLSEQRTSSGAEPSYPISNILKILQDASSSESENDASRESESPLKKLKTPQKKRPRGKSKKLKGTPELKTRDVVKAGIASSLSGSQLAWCHSACRGCSTKGAIRDKQSILGRFWQCSHKIFPGQWCCTNVHRRQKVLVQNNSG